MKTLSKPLLLAFSIILSACSSKTDGVYFLDISATKSTPDFILENEKTNGGATIGLQLAQQLMGTLKIENGKFILISLECKINSDLTRVSCSDLQDKEKPPSEGPFSLKNGVIVLSNGNSYPMIFKSTKNVGSATAHIAQPVPPKPEEKSGVTASPQVVLTAPAPAPAPAPGPGPGPGPGPAVDSSPFSPSFDCTKASNGQEKLVCGDRELAKLDVDLSQAYAKAKEKSSDKEKLKKQQLEWIKFSLRACSDKNCLVSAYQSRIFELQ